MNRMSTLLNLVSLCLCALTASCYDKAPILSSTSCSHEAPACVKLDTKARILKAHLPQARAHFDTIHVFGDSLSDIGRYHSYTRGLIFPESVYWKGRASNGPIWIDYVIGALEIPANNYAFAGAPTRPPKFPYHLIFPSLREQMNEYETLHGTQPQSNSLAILWVGGNNYIYSGRRTDVVDYTIADIQASSDKILASGVQGLVLVNLPDLSAVEYLPKDFSREEYRKRLKFFSEEHNRKLLGVIEDLKKRYPEKVVSLMDAYEMGQYLRTQRDQLGFSRLDQACYRGDFFPLDAHPRRNVPVLRPIGTGMLCIRPRVCTVITRSNFSIA